VVGAKMPNLPPSHPHYQHTGCKCFGIRRRVANLQLANIDALTIFPFVSAYYNCLPQHFVIYQHSSVLFRLSLPGAAEFPAKKRKKNGTSRIGSAHRAPKNEKYYDR
tara:strand:- start:1019 stop:1339 length:321 start_codon:yes stop_codon:yes gene_type:complete